MVSNGEVIFKGRFSCLPEVSDSVFTGPAVIIPSLEEAREPGLITSA